MVNWYILIAALRDTVELVLGAWGETVLEYACLWYRYDRSVVGMEPACGRNVNIRRIDCFIVVVSCLPCFILSWIICCVLIPYIAVRLAIYAALIGKGSVKFRGIFALLKGYIYIYQRDQTKIQDV